ncbi:MAG: hypothetical protein Q8L86_10250 [Vicinamibacterales bacterium]|nr:hypothetical protein [Vicinamibacterales bacterium]
MKKVGLLVVLLAFYALWYVGTVTNPPPPPTTSTQPARTRPVVAADPTGCVPHAVIHSSAYWAAELGQPEAVVLQTHRINLWNRPDDRRQKVGEMRVGSRAVILDERDGFYRVRSPLDNAAGWVNELQVESVVHADTETRELCTPSS